MWFHSLMSLIIRVQRVLFSHMAVILSVLWESLFMSWEEYHVVPQFDVSNYKSSTGIIFPYGSNSQCSVGLISYVVVGVPCGSTV